jgi:hypothetical protein
MPLRPQMKHSPSDFMLVCCLVLEKIGASFAARNQTNEIVVRHFLIADTKREFERTLRRNSVQIL